jgi:hypothetical protein
MEGVLELLLGSDFLRPRIFENDESKTAKVPSTKDEQN